MPEGPQGSSPASEPVSEAHAAEEEHLRARFRELEALVHQRAAGWTPIEETSLNDGPRGVCDRCGRFTWTTDDIGEVDIMIQPDGTQCGGTFVHIGHATVSFPVPDQGKPRLHHVSVVFGSPEDGVYPIITTEEDTPPSAAQSISDILADPKAIDAIGRIMETLPHRSHSSKRAFYRESLTRTLTAIQTYQQEASR